MTIQSSVRRAGPYPGNGSGTQFPFSFKVFGDTQLRVFLRVGDTGADLELTLSSDYTVTLNADQEGNPGGSVNYPVSGLPLPASSYLTIIGGLAYDQTADLPEGGRFFPETVETGLDRLSVQIQQLVEVQERALTLPASSTADPQLPVGEANKFIAWNSSASALVNRDGADMTAAVVYGTWFTDVFSGDGTTTGYTLTQDPGSTDALDIAIGGVSQVNGVDFTSAGAALTFTTAPPLGVGNIAVRYTGALAVGTADARDVVFSHLASQPAGSVALALQALVNVKNAPYNATGDGVANDTPAIQAAIDDALAAGGGTVLIPAGVFSLGASTRADVFENANTTKVANTGCLILPTGVYLKGDSKTTTVLKPTSAELTCILHVSPLSGGVSNLRIDSQWAAGDPETQGHGIFTLAKEAPTDADRVLKNVTYEKLAVVNQAAYGIGLQGYADMENVVLRDVEISVTGLDNIDTKYRGPTKQHEGCSMTNMQLSAPGLRSADQCALDVRGPWRLSSISIKDIGTSTFSTQAGIRFRTYEPAAPNSNPYGQQAEYATLENFLVDNTVNNCNTDGIQFGSAYTKACNGTVAGCTDNFHFSGNASGAPDYATAFGCTSVGASQYGFYVGGVMKGVQLVGCVDDGSTSAGFRNEGDATVMVACATSAATTTPLSSSVGAQTSSTILGSPFGGTAYLGTNASAGLIELGAKGAAADVDLRLAPKGAGKVRFGAHVTSGDVPVTGYLEVKDAGGTVRRLAVVG